MKIELPPQVWKLIQQRLDEGPYDSAADVVHAALLALELHVALLREQVELGREASKAGRIIDLATAKRRTPRKATRRSTARVVLEFNVVLEGTDPSVWRTLRLGDDATFWSLHVAIQDAMGWQDCHLHAFEVGNVRLGIPAEYETETLPGWEHRVLDYVGEPGEYFVYEYDFGDSWRHRVTLSALHPRGKGERYPQCTGGDRCCPPEDVGGVPGFECFLEAMNDVSHAEHKSMKEWYGGPFIADDFDAAMVRFTSAKRRLKELFEAGGF